MRRILFPLFLLLTLPVMGVIPPFAANVLVDCEFGSVGDVLTASVLNSQTHGSGGSWQAGEAAISSYKIYAGGEFLARGPVDIAGTVYYDTNSTRGFRIDNDFEKQYFKYVLSGTGQPKVSVGCFWKLEGFTGSTFDYYDIIHLDSLGGEYSVFNFVDNSSGQLVVRSHSTDNSNAGVGPNIVIQTEKMYWISLLYDSTAAGAPICKVAVFDPLTWRQVGATSTHNMVSRANCMEIRWGRTDGHGQTFTGKYFVFDDFTIDWSNAVFPLLPPGATVKAANTTRTEILAAYGEAIPGDTVLLPAGSVTITNSIGLAKEITFSGSGTNSTIITYDGQYQTISNDYRRTTPALLLFSPNMRVTQLQIRGIDLTNQGRGLEVSNNNARIDHVYFQQLYWAMYLHSGYDEVDNILARNCEKFIRFHGHGAGTADWANYPLSMDDTNHYTCIEDSVFQIDSEMPQTGTNGVGSSLNFTSSQQGASWCIRNCHFYHSKYTEAPYHDLHGNIDPGLRGVLSIQLYNNTYHLSGTALCYKFVDFRGGEGQICSNSFVGGDTVDNIVIREEDTIADPLTPPFYDHNTNIYVWENREQGVLIPVQPLGSDARTIIQNKEYFLTPPAQFVTLPYPHPRRGEAIAPAIPGVVLPATRLTLRSIRFN